MKIIKDADRLANILLESARRDEDIEAAAMLRKLAKVYEAAYEMVYARTHEHSRDSYKAMVDLIKGKQVD